MTCIIGIADGATVWMGGDSCISDYYTNTILKHPKVFIVETHGERFVIGAAGSGRTLQVLEHKLDVPSNETDKDAYAFMVGEVVEAVKSLLKKEGCVTTENEQGSMDSELLVGYRGRLFKVQTDYAVVENVRGYAATGTGEKTAMGALFVQPNIEPAPRIMAALVASAEFVTTVQGPFYVVALEP